MGIANELSSDVAAAVLARKDHRVQAETNELVEIVRNFHSAMCDLMGEERRHRLSTGTSSDSTQADSRAVSGGH